jgi:hypothetical protein
VEVLSKEQLRLELIRLETKLVYVEADNEQLKLELGQKQLELDVRLEELAKLIDRERNLTDRLLDRQLGLTSHPSSQTSELKPIGSRGGQWGPKAAGYERLKRDEARVAAKAEADAKKAMWEKKVAEIDSLDKLDKRQDAEVKPSV